MIDIKNKVDCCGCNACVDICPKDCINLETDTEGFWYPKVDLDKCINCGLCERTCPIINIKALKKNEFDKPVCFAAINKDIEVRYGSTTGGLFSALAEEMYAQGGYVGGAIYGENFKVQHFISNNREDLLRLRQSKYSQSDTVGFFTEVKKLLVAGEKVLICGTPCQMAAMRRFLNKDYDNLIIVDFICKSITSPLFYSKYLDYWERKAKSKLVGFKFKDKELGWRSLGKRFDFKNGRTIYSGKEDNDLFTLAYHENIISRPSCYECEFKGLPRIADITLADFWGCEKYEVFKDIDDNAGTSAVMCNNQKGLDFFYNLKGKIDYRDATIEQIMPGNPALLHKQKQPSIDRDNFFKDLNNEPIEDVLPRYLKGLKPRKLGIKEKITRLIRPLKTAWHFGNHSLWQMSRFLYYNLFCSRIKIDWFNEGVLYPTPYSIIELQKKSQIELNGPLIVGAKILKKSRQETRLLVKSNGRLIVREYFKIGYGSDIQVFSQALLDIRRMGINCNCTLICGDKITIEGQVSVGRDVSIRDTNAHIIAMDGYKVTRPVTIGHHVWLCSGATICPGVKIREGAIVGSNSYVIQNVKAHTLVSGNPAKVVQQEIAWKY